MSAAYFHVPFCLRKCGYCDFYSVADSEGSARQAAFVDALIREIDDRVAGSALTPATVFVGGGTPTLLTPPQWSRLLAAMRGRGLLDRVTEFTVEANPETVTPALLGVLADGGVNRLSIGAQSFDRATLDALDRWHDPANVDRAVALARDAGIGNFNLDLIFAVPGQTLDALDRDLDRLLALDPPHVSCYGLTYEPNTPMTVRLGRGEFTPAPEPLEAAMYARVIDRLEAAGYEHYEVSAFAKAGSAARGPGSVEGGSDGTRATGPATRCQHNLTYWTTGQWLGFGPGAASHVGGQRWKNAPRVETYTRTSPDHPVVDHEVLTPEQRRAERLMMGLRLREGVPADQDVTARQRDADRLAGLGLVELVADRLRLTRRGLMVADGVIAELV